MEPGQAIRPGNLVDNAGLNAIQADTGEDYPEFVRYVASLGIISKRIWPVTAIMNGRRTVYQSNHLEDDDEQERVCVHRWNNRRKLVSKVPWFE